jgi:hypothetical protein
MTFFLDIAVTQDPTRKLAYPDYRNPKWQTEPIIYGENEGGLTWEYSDRMISYNRPKHEESETQASEAGAVEGTAQYIEQYLRAYYDAPTIQLICVLGSTLPNGQPYYVYGFRK